VQDRGKRDLARVKSDVGRRVAELRRVRIGTQEQLARAMGFDSVSHVKSIEGGKANLTLRSLVELAEVLRVDVSALLAEPAHRRPRRPGRPAKFA